MVSSPSGALSAPFDCESSRSAPEQAGAMFRKELKLRPAKFLQWCERES
jgi:hypothetical protein